MKFLLAALLSAANLAAAAPVSNAEPGTSPATTFLGKRIAPSSNCGLDMYPTATQRPIMHGIFYLNGDTSDGDPLPPSIIWGTPGQCNLISCSGQTGFFLCVDSTSDGRPVPFQPSTLGHQIDSTYHDCYGGPPADDDTPIRAFQFWGQGYNLLVQGNQNC